MKNLTAPSLRVLLYAALIVCIVLFVSIFTFGYQHLQTAKDDTNRRQADAAASEDSINDLYQLRIELEKQASVIDKLGSLRTDNSLPQFDTEKSLRTIAEQTGVPIRNVTFLEADASTGVGETPAPAQPASSGWGGSINSRVSFELGRAISYDQLIRFLHAIETSTPKLRLEGIDLPTEATSSSVNPGTLILEVATS